MTNARTAKFRQPRGKSLRFESLEDRSMLAGNMTVGVLNGTLVLDGDNNANQVQVWQSGTNQWKVQGLGTKINGSYAIKTYNGVHGISAFLIKGDDFIRVFNGNLSGQLLIDDGGYPRSIQSNDVVQISNVRANSIRIDTNDGSDSVLIDKSRAITSITVDTTQTITDGNDAVTILNSQARDQVIVITGDGSDVVTIQGLTAPDATLQVRTDSSVRNRTDNDSVSLVKVNAFTTLIDTGEGVDAVAISQLAGTNLELDLGAGNDVATLSQVALASTASIDAGAGTDAVTLTRVSVQSRLFAEMDDGNYDRLTVVQCSSDLAIFEGGFNTGDTLVLVQNNFETLQQSGFQHVIGA